MRVRVKSEWRWTNHLNLFYSNRESRQTPNTDVSSRVRSGAMSWLVTVWWSRDAWRHRRLFPVSSDAFIADRSLLRSVDMVDSVAILRLLLTPNGKKFTWLLITCVWWCQRQGRERLGDFGALWFLLLICEMERFGIYWWEWTLAAYGSCPITTSLSEHAINPSVLGLAM